MADELDHSYYVYIHVDKATDIPFYVGKGKGPRAHSEKGRGAEWREKLASLPGGYAVEIVSSGLSEPEAWEAERQLISKHGKVHDGTGTLVNRTDGGEYGFPLLEFELPDFIGDIFRRDYESKTYLELDAEAERQLLDRIENQLKDIATRSDAQEEESDLALAFGMALDMVKDAARLRRRRSISWKDFAYSLHEAAEEIESALDPLGDDGAEENSLHVICLAREFHQMLCAEVARLTQP